MTPKNKTICYAYIGKTNDKHLRKLSAKTGQSISYILDVLIEAHRLGREAQFVEKVPKYVLQAREYEKKQKQRQSAKK